MRADDIFIIQNYRPVFISNLCERLPVPQFKSNDNKDLYDIMMVEGAYIQLDLLLSDHKSTLSAASISNTIEDYDMKMATKKGKSTSLQTLEEDVTQKLKNISEQRPELSDTIKILNLHALVKDIATRRKLDSIKDSFEGGHDNQKEEKMISKPEDYDSGESIKMLLKENSMMKEALKKT